MLRLNCFILVEEDKYDMVLDAAIKLTEASRLQEGCVAYDVFRSATHQDVLMICETWRDQAALDAHSASGEFVKYAGIMRENSQMKLETFSF